MTDVEFVDSHCFTYEQQPMFLEKLNAEKNHFSGDKTYSLEKGERSTSAPAFKGLQMYVYLEIRTALQ